MGLLPAALLEMRQPRHPFRRELYSAAARWVRPSPDFRGSCRPRACPSRTCRASSTIREGPICQPGPDSASRMRWAHARLLGLGASRVRSCACWGR